MLLSRLRISFAISLALALSGTVLSADAQTRTYSRSAASGASKWMDEYTGWNNDCSFKIINVDIVEPPAHGRVTPKVTKSTIKNITSGTASHCIGKPARVVQVYYKSQRGYR